MSRHSSLSDPGGGSDGTMKSTTFTKVTDNFGALPVGAEFTWTYTTAGERQAVDRARKAFENAARLDPGYKDERLSDWRLT